MKQWLVTVALLAAALNHPSAGPQSEGRVPVLAELFTSEGCSSCPPADELLERILRQQPIEGVYVVALSEHVTYWDRQGWKDPFGASRFTARQEMYAFRFGLASSFTPQLVIDGVTQIVGSDTTKIQIALDSAGRQPKSPLYVDASVVGDVLIGTAAGPGLAAVDAGERANLLWAIVEDNLVSAVKRGENANRTLRHSGVVRTLVTRGIESRPGTEVRETIGLRPDWKREHLRLVAFVQAAKSKRVLSIGWDAVDDSR